ncbi:MAG: type II toxin-antitoxin system PemK/MazF family toxin [Rhodospirillales bacterium]
MKRGEIWTVAGGPDFAGKPRPAVIVQADAADATRSVTLCPLTSDDTETQVTRVRVEPSAGNRLKFVSYLMTDKITTTYRSKLGRRIGRLDDGDILRLNKAIIVFLGLA